MNKQISISQGWEGYFKFDTDFLVQNLTTRKPQYFERKSKGMALSLFYEMSKNVPAYKDFLKKNKIKPDDINTYADLEKVPWIDKENYLKKYSLDELSWNGKLDSPIISASSGSSGVPTFWPRSNNIEMETTYIYELFLKHFFEINKYKTLLVSGFSMGIYVGGTFTLNCCMRLAKKGYPLTIVTPGVNQKEIVEAVNRLHPYFDQIIIGGYPPFVRDIVDEIAQKGINLKNKKMRLFYASEALSESLRDYIYMKVGVKKKDYLHSSMNLYGTADAAIAGHESPLSILVRQLFSKDIGRCMDYFGTSYVPSLNMYYPFFKHFQIIDGEVVLSTKNNQIPLCKYNIHDRGRIIPFDEMIEITKSFGMHKSELEKLIGKDLLWRMPYIYLYGRSDFSVTIYGLNVYPENIKSALETFHLRKYATGKFLMETKNRSKTQDQYLQIHIELRDGVKISKKLNKLFQKIIIQSLRKLNLEYNHLYQAIKSKANPEIALYLKGDNKYFAPATKQKWVKKNNNE